MKKQTKVITIIVGVIILVVAGIGGKMYMDHQEKEAYYLEKQRGLVKQIKLTFADVEEIKFEKGSIDSPGIGASTMINTTIKTKSEKRELVLRFPYHKEEEQDSLNFAIGNGPKEGKTHSKVKVTYENGTQEER